MGIINIKLDLDGLTGSPDRIRSISPIGTVKKIESFDNNLDWTFLTKPETSDYGSILLEGGNFNDTEFIVDDFGLDNPHSWKRHF